MILIHVHDTSTWLSQSIQSIIHVCHWLGMQKNLPWKCFRTAFGHYDLLSTSKLDACANVTTCCLNPVHLNRQINFSVAKENVGFWLFLTYNTASSKWIRTATKFTLVVQNASFLCHAEYCRSIEKKEVESLNQLRCRIPFKGSFLFFQIVS